MGKVTEKLNLSFIKGLKGQIAEQIAKRPVSLSTLKSITNKNIKNIQNRLSELRNELPIDLRLIRIYDHDSDTDSYFNVEVDRLRESESLVYRNKKYQRVSACYFSNAPTNFRVTS